MNLNKRFKLSALFILLLIVSTTATAEIEFKNMSVEGATGLESDVYPDMSVNEQSIYDEYEYEYVRVEPDYDDNVTDALIRLTCSWPESYSDDNYVGFLYTDLAAYEFYEISELNNTEFEHHDNNAEIGDNYISFYRPVEEFLEYSSWYDMGCGLEEDLNETGVTPEGAELDTRIELYYYRDLGYELRWLNNVSLSISDGKTFYEEDTIVLNSYDWFSDNYSINYNVNEHDYSTDYSDGLYNATLEYLDDNKTEEVVIPYGVQLEPGDYRFNASYHVPMGFNNSGGVNTESVTFEVLDEHERVEDEDVIEIVDSLIMIAIIMILYGAATNMNKLKRVTKVD